MIDTHAHLDNSQFDADRAEVIRRAFAEGLTGIIIPSIEPKNFDAVRAIADENPRIWRGIGIHPHNAHEAQSADLARVEREAADENVVAVGEIGLDYYYDFAPRDVQQRVFREQVRLAKRAGKPVVVHNRESDDDVLRILGEEQDGTLRGVLHCFSGAPAMLAEVIRLGFCVSYTGNITYKKSTLGETVAATPLERMMIETDAPYMTPVPHRGKRNEPSFVQYIAAKVAELHGLTTEAVITATTATARSLFRLPLILAFALAALTPVFGQQSGNPRDEEYEDDEEIDPPNPYRKWFGIAPVIGTNTIIEQQECGNDVRKSISYEGIVSFGVSANYGLLEFLTLDASYIFSHNTRKEVTEYYADGNYHHFFNFGARFCANPRNRISFFAVAGVSVAFNEVFGRSNQKLGINAGIGFEGHFPTSFGMLVPTAEWRLDFPFKGDVINGPGTSEINPNYCNGQYSDVYTYYSIPRFALYWYPNL